MLCFFSAMLVTNDVALITFVPVHDFTAAARAFRGKADSRYCSANDCRQSGQYADPCWQSAESLSLYHFGDGVGAFFRITRRLFSCPSFCCFCSPFAGKHLLSHTAADNATHTDKSRKTTAFRLDGAVFSLPAGSFPHPARSAAVGVGTGVVSAVSKRDSERGGLLPAAHVCIFLYPDWESGTDFRHTRSPPKHCSMAERCLFLF